MESFECFESYEKDGDMEYINAEADIMESTQVGKLTVQLVG